MNARDFKRFLRDLLRPIRLQISNLVARGTVSLVYDEFKMQELQLKLLADELKDNIEHFQNYGFTAHPHIGAEALTLFLNGNRDHGVTLVVDDRRYRIKGLQQGEVAIYTDENDQGSGHSITLKRGRVIDMRCDVLNITADSSVSVNANAITLNASGTLTENSNEHRVNTTDYEASQS